MQKKYAHIDKSRLPLVVIDFEPEPESLESFKLYLTEMEEMYKEADNLIIIFNAAKTKYLSAEMRIMQGKWLKENKDTIAKKAKHMIFIIPNIVVQMILKAILIIQPLPAQHTLVKSKEEAMQFAENMLQEIPL